MIDSPWARTARVCRLHACPPKPTVASESETAPTPWKYGTLQPKLQASPNGLLQAGDFAEQPSHGP